MCLPRKKPSWISDFYVAVKTVKSSRESLCSRHKDLFFERTSTVEELNDADRKKGENYREPKRSFQ